MNPKELYDAYYAKKEQFHAYIDRIKQSAPIDFYTIVNPALVKNPYISQFPKDFFTQTIRHQSRVGIFFKSMITFYGKNSYLLITYGIAFILFKLFYRKKRENKHLATIIDIFLLVDKINANGIFQENYFGHLYDYFEKYNRPYTLLPRLYQIGKNPFKLISFFKIINHDKRHFLFEFEVLRWKDFIAMFIILLCYPWKTLRLYQTEKRLEDRLFNQSLLSEISAFNFQSLTRYVLGKNLAPLKDVKRIYSWSEFQVVERSFNYAIRRNNEMIRLIACQFYLNYETYFNAYIDDLDDTLKTSPHEVLVNGNYYLLQRKNIKYSVGVSLRYQKVFDFKGVVRAREILLLGSYIEEETKYMLQSVEQFGNVLFKNHPAVPIARLGVMPSCVHVVSEDIYTLFEHAKVVIGSASGSLVEAIACGVSVVILASKDNLTANPLVAYGQGKIWDVAFSKEEVFEVYDKLIQYRNENNEEIKKIALWYKENFFVEPSEENIVSVFGLKKE